MEIITDVREGAITHRDILGNEGRTEAGDVQVMSAGRGITDSKFNLKSASARIFRISIRPDSLGDAPSSGARPIPKSDRSGRFVTLASGFGDDREALPLRTRARVPGAALRAGESTPYRLGSRRRAYPAPSTGAVEINGIRLKAGDGAAIRDEPVSNITAIHDAELVLVDTDA